MKPLLLYFPLLLFTFTTNAQNDPNLESRYKYNGNLEIRESPWAIKGEFQFSNHNFIGNLQQLLIRTGLQYTLKNELTSFQAGYSLVTNQTEKLTNSIQENASFQEAVLRQGIARLWFSHRFRYEQRWITNSEFRTRIRYGISLNVPLNSKNSWEKGSYYLQASDDVFINGKRIGQSLGYFDRNRLYLGLGYRYISNLAIQIGIMEQTTKSITRTLLQFSFNHQMYSRK